jgi:hypothetical protein
MTRFPFESIWHSTSDCIYLCCICRIIFPIANPGLTGRFKQSAPYPP